jgi:hypothetical protein
LFQEFWKIDISKSLKHELGFIHAGEGSLLDTGSIDDGLYGSHTIIIMLLGRKLLRVQGESSDHLSGKTWSFLVTEGIEGDSTNLGVVRDHHCHWTEECLKVIGELSTTSITGVHGNESAESRLHLDDGVFEVELINLISLG